MPPKRMTANPLAAPRYRSGKPLPANEPSSESESESDSEDDAAPAPRQAPPKAASFPKISADLKSREAAATAAQAREAALRKKREEEEEGFVTASDTEESGNEDEDGSEESSEGEEDYSSEEDGGRRRFVAPTFVRKGARKEVDTREEERRREREAEEEERRRKQKVDEMLQGQIEREARERAEGRREWDEEEGLELEDVDDRDGVDPEAEHAAWKLRELKRVKREGEAIEVAEKEREEVERRRGLTREEREKEDSEWIEKQKEEREGRGKMSYMQKYFHKGAFFQEDGDEEVLEAKKRDIAGHRFEDDAVNRELLPQYMQIRDMTKLGKKGRTRYKDMRSEDTGSFGADLQDRRGRGDAGGRYKDGPSGANGVAVGERRPREDDRGGREEKRPRYD
ncbi:hypothetical protein B9Z65_6956 [Elsinoe australis]|uniref:Micro-fibrillar-associated protein 1 C-terminal domain-containing protein n=1 Tax=Elsinoe australis TaxID=40998 RepID=A0A2P7Z460_9PEZI|nr:hypothetical protein B9Z65_6956 [Elsinoe australis]